MKRIMKILCCGMLFLSGCQHDEPKPDPIEEEPIKIVSNDTYADPKNPSNAYAQAFNQLSADLKDENMEKVSEDVAICFVFDFFTLKNKQDASDIGGLAYLPQNRVDEFAAFAQQHFYRNYDSIVTEKGVDSLPEVIHVTIDSKKEKQVDYLDEDYRGYEYEISVEYAETKMNLNELKTKLTMTCLIYNGKAMVIALN